MNRARTCAPVRPFGSTLLASHAVLRYGSVPRGEDRRRWRCRITSCRLALLLTVAFLIALLAACGSSKSTTQAPLLPDGTYVFHLAGEDYHPSTQNSSPFFVSGAFTVAGGVITQGEEDFADYEGVASALPIQSLGSSISLTSDGNLQIKLYTGMSGPVILGVSGTQTINVSLVSSTSARIAEFDASAMGTGTMDLQSSPAAPSGGYAFFVAGLDNNTFPLAVGGIVNVDGSGTISGNGSVFDLNDGQNTKNGLGVQTAQLFSPSTVSAPDSFGRVIFTLTPSNTSIGQIMLVGYEVNSATIHLVEIRDGLLGAMGGTAFGQGSNTGNFSNNSISGFTYAAGARGGDAVGRAQLAGALAFNSDGSVTGQVSFNDLATQIASGSIAAGATYSVDPTGRVTVSSLTATDPTSGKTYGPAAFQLYLDGSGDAPIVSMYTGDATGGIGFQQTAGASLSGSYAISAIGAASVTNPTTGITSIYPWGAVGQASAGNGGLATGFTDLDVLANPQAAGTQTPAVSLAGAQNNTGYTIAGLGYASTANQYTYYVIDSNRGFAIETDAVQLSEAFAQASTGSTK